MSEPDDANPPDPFEALLGLQDPDQLGALLMLSLWVDQQRAIAQHGYPKDNAIPAPLPQRLADVDYLSALLDEARSDEEIEAATVAALERALAELKARP